MSFFALWIMGNIMQITWRRTSISLSAMFSQNWLNPIMQREINDGSVRRALPVYSIATKSSPMMHHGGLVMQSNIFQFRLFDIADIICKERKQFSDRYCFCLKDRPFDFLGWGWVFSSGRDFFYFFQATESRDMFFTVWKPRYFFDDQKQVSFSQ